MRQLQGDHSTYDQGDAGVTRDRGRVTKDEYTYKKSSGRADTRPDRIGRTDRNMPRPRTINRDMLLDAAERVVAAHMATGLTFGNVASEAGVPKASVQSAFGTREALIEAMLDRWLKEEDARFQEATRSDRSPLGRLKAHIHITADETVEIHRRVATLLASLAGSGEQSASAARWYDARIGDLSAISDVEKQLRIGFLAAEGAYFLRYLVGLPMSDERWNDIFADLKEFLTTSEKSVS